jgi:hypothetical protein
MNENCLKPGYKIIIPQEEPKQESCCTPIGQIKRYVDCKGCDRKPKQEKDYSALLQPVGTKQETLEETAENFAIDKQNDKTIRSTVKLTKERRRVLNDKEETKWGISKCTSPATKNWTTCISEKFSNELINYLFNKKINNNKKRKICIPDNPDCKPDIEIENYIFEIKCKKWHSNGTAGEKILGTPIKYNQIADATGKYVRIILLAGQEEEAVLKYHLFDVSDFDTRNMEQLELWYNQGTQFIKGSDLIKLAIMK